MILFYFFRTALRNISQRFFTLLGLVLVLSVCLVLILSSLLVSYDAGEALEQVMSKNSFSVYLSPDQTLADAKVIQRRLESIPYVKETQYLTEEEIYKTLVANLSGEEADSSYVDGFSRRNIMEDLGGGFTVTLTDYFQMQSAMDEAAKIKGVASVNGLIQTAVGLASTQRAFLMLSLFLIVVVFFISLFLIYNSVQLAFYARREEISTMQIVGASTTFIVAPFLAEGLLLGTLGGLLAFPLQFGATRFLAFILAENQLADVFRFHSFNDVWKLVLIGFPLSGAFLGVTCSGIAANRLLKRNHPF